MHLDPITNIKLITKCNYLATNSFVLGEVDSDSDLIYNGFTSE